LYLLDSDRDRAVKVLAKHGAASDDLLVAIHPGSGSRAKNWPVANFLDLASDLVEAYKAQILFVVGPGEEGIKQDLLRPVRSKRLVILDSLPLPVLGAILERCCGFVGNDSGITHMAAAVGIPVVTIFGPSDPGRWAPKGEKVSLVRRGLSCSPCGREFMSRCESRQCLSEISVDHVYRALTRVIEKRRDKNACILAYRPGECREPGAIGASP